MPSWPARRFSPKRVRARRPLFRGKFFGTEPTPVPGLFKIFVTAAIRSTMCRCSSRTRMATSSSIIWRSVPFIGQTQKPGISRTQKWFTTIAPETSSTSSFILRSRSSTGAKHLFGSEAQTNGRNSSACQSCGNICISTPIFRQLFWRRSGHIFSIVSPCRGPVWLSSVSRPRLESAIRGATYSCAMTPLPNEWAVKRRADACAVTRRPFVTGEYFYTLLFHDADGYRREDLSEEAWQNRNENIQPFSFWKSRYEPLPAPSPEPLPKENAEQLFRRLISSETSNPSACYVLAAMLERKRVVKQIKTEAAANGRLLIYEHGATGEVFIVPDPRLRLDELEGVQNEVASLLQTAAHR